MANKIKIVTLIENQLSDKKELYTEHGLSIYIEIDGKHILFDTGQSGNFIKNAEKLNIDLNKLDYVIISHGHYDHSGGVEKLIKDIKPNIQLYVGKDFFKEKYKLLEGGSYKYIGNPFDREFLMENNITVKYIEDDILNITDNLLVFTNFDRTKEFENTNQKMYLKEGGQYKKDEFLDEITLGIKTDKGLVIVVGCSHPGIINILDTIIQRTGRNIDTLIGGTHLVDEDKQKINKIIKNLKGKNIKRVGACHCTGEKAVTMLREQLKDNFIDNKTGYVLET